MALPIANFRLLIADLFMVLSDLEGFFKSAISNRQSAISNVFQLPIRRTTSLPQPDYHRHQES